MTHSDAQIPDAKLAEVEAAKRAVAANFSREEQLALKALADRLRNRPMNRKQRRAFAARVRKVGLA